MSRLIAVSNRVAVPRPANQPTAGGLAVALQAALKRSKGIWFGWSGEVSEAHSTHLRVTKGAGITFATIDLLKEDYDAYYNGYANRTLWPLCHYRTDLVVYDRRNQKGYYRVNALFAHALATLLEPGDLIWVHDYHLIACAEELRRMGFRQRMGFFLHIPFPCTPVLMTVPNHEAIVRALFAYDVVGVQTESDLRALRDYVVFEAGGHVEPDGCLTAFGRTIHAAAFPIGIDAAGFSRMSTSATAKSYFQRVTTSMADKELIIGVDRLDYSKGLVQRFEAFERLLEDYPENRGHVSLLQVAPPSRMDVPEYVEIHDALDAASGRINGKFGEFDWVPIRYQNNPLSRAALAGLYRASRIGLVTPYRDGMNLVAKEYVAAQDPANPGSLVLSQFAGAATQLQEGAFIVNPYDTDAVVEAIQRSLRLPLRERRKRWQNMMTEVRKHDVGWWCDAFIKALSACEEDEASKRTHEATATGRAVPKN